MENIAYVCGMLPKNEPMHAYYLSSPYIKYVCWGNVIGVIIVNIINYSDTIKV